MSQVFCLQLKCNINIFLNPLIKIFTKRKKKAEHRDIYRAFTSEGKK